MSKPNESQLIFALPKTDLSQGIMAFLIDRQARGLSKRTIRFYRDELRFLQSWLEKRQVLRVKDITADLLRQYLLDLGQRRNAGGVHCAFRAMRAWLRWCWAEYELPGPCPMDKVRGPKLSAEPLEPVSISDLKAILATCERKTFTDARDRALIMILADTGLRAAECLSLRVADVNVATGAVWVEHGKGNKRRVVFMGRKARQALLKYLRLRQGAATCDLLWVTERGDPLSYNGLRSILRRRAQMAGVAAPTAHDFRRFFGLAMLKNGADLLTVARLLGHSSLAVISRYVKQAQDDLRAVHERAAPMDRLLALLLGLGRLALRVFTERG